jgi:hypothetical protein
MPEHRVAIFEPYPFEPGQKIRIADGPRRGDWEVVAATGKDVTLRCPISGREFTWKRFCYRVAERESEWPSED